MPQSQPPPSDSNWLQSIKHMMSDMTNDMACKTRDMLGGIQNTLQAQIDVVISDVRSEAGQSSSDIAKCTNRRAKHTISWSMSNII